MKVQVMTIISVQKSSKSELSSGIFGHFTIWKKLEHVLRNLLRDTFKHMALCRLLLYVDTSKHHAAEKLVLATAKPTDGC